MYKLFWAPGTAAMAPQAMLEEIGATYEMVKLDLATKEHHQAPYKKLNPTGWIPTFVDGDFVIFETVAICLYLCDKHPGANLAPPAGSPARGRFYQWLTYMTNTTQVGFIDWYHPYRMFPDAAGQAALKSAAQARLEQSFGVLDAGIGAGRHLAGDRFTVADIYLTMLTRWSRNLPKPMWHWPNIKRLAAATQARPAFQRMMEKQGIAWPDNWPKD
jgi:glutathione S-transferase